MNRATVVRAPHGLALAPIAPGLGGPFIGTGGFAAIGLFPDVTRSAAVSVPRAGA